MDKDMDSQTFLTIANAIVNRQLLVGTYDRRYREFLPFVVGHKKDGTERALVLQIAGDSRSGTVREPTWKCLTLKKLTIRESRDYRDEWETPQDYDPDTQWCIPSNLIHRKV